MFAILYVIDKDIFVDKTAGELEDDEEAYYPRAGLPTLLAKTYNIFGLLWGKTTYLVDKEDLTIRLDDFV